MNGCEAGGVRMRGAGHGGHFALCARARGDRGVIPPAPTPLVARGFSSGSRT